MAERHRPIAFESGKQVSLSDNRYKIYSSDGGKTCELYDLTKDPSEQTNLAGKHADVVESMSKAPAEWRSSCKSSLEGRDCR